MIVSGRIFKLFSPSYVNRGELMQRRDDARSLDTFLDSVWREREPISPVSRGPWPMRREETLAEVVTMAKRAAR